MPTTAGLGYQLHRSFQALDIYVKPILFIVLWYTSAMQCIRLLHLLSIGPTAFAQHFGLTTWQRIRLFMWSAPTIQFLRDSKRDDTTPPSSSLSIHHSASYRLLWQHFHSEWQKALLDILGMDIICAMVLKLDLSRRLPLLLQALIRVYIMGFSTSVLKILMEIPAYYYILTHLPDGDDTKIRFFPIYNRPHLTQSPRNLWHRWSVTAGYHLRLAYYEPMMQHFRTINSPSSGKPTMLQRLLATAAPFAANCLLHITWWSIVIKGELDFIYWNVLFAYPLVSVWIEDIFAGLWNRPSSDSDKNKNTHWLHQAFNFVILWAGFVVIGGPMSTAHGLNSELTAVSRVSLLLPPLPAGT